MSFVQTDEWYTSDTVPAARTSSRPRETRTPARSQFRKSFAAGGSLLVHLLLLYLFVNKLLGAQDDIRSPGSNGPSLLVFDMADPSESSKPKPKQTAAAPVEAVQAVTPPPPPEWKMTRLPQISTISLSPVASTPGLPSSSAGGEPSAGGGGDYDPYAGAAPMRLVPPIASADPALAKPAGNGASPAESLNIDENLIEKIKSLIRNKIKGSARPTMTITVGTDGRLIDVEFSGLEPSLADQVRDYLAHVRLLKPNRRIAQPEVRVIVLR